VTNEAKILSILTDLHLAIGQLQGTTNAILDEQQTQNTRLSVVEGAVGQLRTRQAVDEHAQEQTGKAFRARVRHRANIMQGVWLTVAAVVGAGAGGVLHTLGIG
jgi:hypothetical protein